MERRARTGVVVGSIAALAALPLTLAACGLGGEERRAPTTRAPAQPAAAARPATDKDYDRNKFSNSTKIDNKWYPLVRGTQFIYEGASDRGQGRRRHRVIFTVTDLTKVIDGVRTVVMWDRDINAGRLLEGELAFHAQDEDGNVWNMGEYPEEYDERGRFEGAPDTWLAGRARARAGILMRADPQVGTSSYLQGRAPAIDFADRAKVYRTAQRDCVPVGCYENVLITDETNPLEPGDGHQLKYYAPGVGNIRAAPRGGREKEVLVLVDVVRLSRKARAAARRQALKLDRRAYRASPDVYGDTRPAR